MSRIPDTAPLSNSRRPGVAVAVACLAMAALVAGCGGGDRVKPFNPSQIIAFGDENSAFETQASTPAVTSIATLKGMRYTINLVTIEGAYCAPGSSVSPTASVCAPPSPAVESAAVFTRTGSDTFTRSTLFPNGVDDRKITELEVGQVTVPSTSSTMAVDRQISRFYFCSPAASSYAGTWVQTLAHALNPSLSFGGDQCSQDVGNGKSYAAWGAKVDDVIAQFNAHRGELHDGVLVTIMAGQNDIMAAYDTYRTTNQEAGLVLMREQGHKLGELINQIVATGARVVFLTLPDMGQSPAAAADRTFARNLTRAFNGYDLTGQPGLEVSVKTNGHKIVKVDGYTHFNNLVAGGGYANAAACSTDPAVVRMPDTSLLSGAGLTGTQLERALLLNCTNENLVGGATLTSHLWADARHFGPITHNSLGALAAARIRDQL